MAPNPEPESEKDPFLDHLRQRFSDEQELPSPELWAALSPQLPVPNPWLTRYVGAGTGLGVVLGLLLGWLVGLPGSSLTPAVAVAPVTPVARHRPAADVVPFRATAPATAGSLVTRRAGRSIGPQRATATARNSFGTSAPVPAPAAASVSAETAVAPPVVAPPKAPVFLLPALWHSALVLDSAIRQETAPPAVPTPPDAEQYVRLAALLAAQQPVLLALQHHLDSLRATTRTALPPVVAAPSRADSLPPLAATTAPDTLQPQPLAPPRRWSALLLTEATTRWGELPGYHAATTHEVLVSARTQAGAVEYHVPDAAGTPGRWRLRAGFGETRLRDQFRFAADTVHHHEEHDTTWALTSTIRVYHDTTFTLRPDSIGRPEPILNSQGQVIGYHTVYDHFLDTTYYVTTRHDTTWKMQESVKASYSTQTERRRQDLRPNYRFWTIPLAVQFDVWQHRRWSAGVSLGAQVLIFAGGSQPVHDAATKTYFLRRIGMHDGPFRPVSLALNTGLDIRYRLTDRLSALVGGQVRGWAVGPLRTGALPRWTSAGQLGLAWELGK